MFLSVNAICQPGLLIMEEISDAWLTIELYLQFAVLNISNKNKALA